MTEEEILWEKCPHCGNVAYPMRLDLIAIINRAQKKRDVTDSTEGKEMINTEETLKNLKINPRLLHGNDTVVRCPKCGRTQALLFKDGLTNGWSTCCGGLTMPIIYHQADVYEATRQAIIDKMVVSVQKDGEEK